MPIHSQHQWGWAFAAEQRGELAPGTAERWARLSAPFAALPSRASGYAGAYAATPAPLPSAPEPVPVPLPAPEPPPYKPRRRLSGLATAYVAAVAVALGLGLAARWSK